MDSWKATLVDWKACVGFGFFGDSWNKGSGLSFAATWMKHRDCYTEWSKSEMEKCRITSLIQLSVWACSVVSNSLWPPWTVAHQAPPSMGSPRQEYWSGLPFPSPGALPDPGIEPGFPALQADFFTTSATWEGQGFPFKYTLPFFFFFSFYRDKWKSHRWDWSSPER